MFFVEVNLKNQAQACHRKSVKLIYFLLIFFSISTKKYSDLLLWYTYNFQITMKNKNRPVTGRVDKQNTSYLNVYEINSAFLWRYSQGKRQKRQTRYLQAISRALNDETTSSFHQKPVAKMCHWFKYFFSRLYIL